MAAALLLLVVASLLATSATAIHEVPDWQIPTSDCVRKPLNGTASGNVTHNVNSSMVLPCSVAYPWEGCCPPGPGVCEGIDNLGPVPDRVDYACKVGWVPACCTKLGAGAPAGELGGAPVSELGVAPAGELGGAPVGELSAYPVGEAPVGE